MSAKLPVGQAAPDFRLRRIGDDGEVSLRSLRGPKPVVLVFANFSCNVFANEAYRVERLYQEHKDQAEFLLVLVREAGHPIPELAFVLDGADQHPRRVENACKAMKVLSLSLPAVSDDEDAKVEKAYQAWPKRLVVVGTDGRIVLDAGLGLAGGWDCDAVAAFLRGQPPSGSHAQ
jgi:hypothetical protein